jgi:hypothetical protein
MTDLRLVLAGQRNAGDDLNQKSVRTEATNWLSSLWPRLEISQ